MGARALQAGLHRRRQRGLGLRRPYAAEHYVDMFRTFAPYLGVDGQVLTKVAAGASGDNYAWTEAVMAGTTKLNMPNGGPPALGALSLHYYTFAGDGPRHTGPATGFDEDHWIGPSPTP